MLSGRLDRLDSQERESPQARTQGFGQDIGLAHDHTAAADVTDERFSDDAAQSPRVLAVAERQEFMYDKLRQALLSVGFLHRDNPEHIMFALRRILGRAGLEDRDVRILLGLARKISCEDTQSPRSIAPQVMQTLSANQVALVFGPEDTGLTNTDLRYCHRLVTIPTAPTFSSLNIASAVQVLCYEIYKINSIPVEERQVSSQECAATSQEIEGYFQHLEQVLTSTQFLDSENPGLLMQRLRRLYQRLELTQSEVNILRGILSSVEKYRSG